MVAPPFGVTLVAATALSCACTRQRPRAHIPEGPRPRRLVQGPVEQLLAPGTLAARGGALADDAARALRARARTVARSSRRSTPQASRGSPRSTRERMQSSRSRRFRTRPEDQAGGAFDGRWLVWAEYHSLTSLDDFTVWAWDSRSETRDADRCCHAIIPRRILGRAPCGRPTRWTGSRRGSRGSAPAASRPSTCTTCRTGRGTIIHRGHAQGSFLFAAAPSSVGPSRQAPAA